MKKGIIFFLLINIFTIVVAKEQQLTAPIPLPNYSKEDIHEDYKMPEIQTSGEDLDGDEYRYLEKTYTVMMESKVDVFIPLEVITDIEVETLVVGNEIKKIPFEVELNRKPEKENYYSIKYSENIIDIDQDGKADTYISSPKYINDRIEKENYVTVYGENISKDGKYNKTVYITVEVGE